ncbi:MAG: hypothetical protein K8U03_09050 [Planctomycetia bacterium]|nr:hypothetical protein [Planctomycetia bacterium]
MATVDDANIAQRIQLWSERAMIALFLPFITLPVLMIRPEAARECMNRHEKRMPNLFPSIHPLADAPLKKKFDEVRAFPKGFETWFNDYVGLRRRFIQLHTLGRLCGVVSECPIYAGKGGGASVVIGENGWLYFSGHCMKEDYTATLPLRDVELEQWAQVVEARAAWLAERGCLYVLMFAPNPHTIYPENVPERIGRQGRRSRLDQLKERLAGVKNLEFIDLRDDLIAAKGRMQTYQRTDTHWNDYGAYVAYRALMSRLSKHLPGVEIMPLDQFEVVAQEIPRSEGDLSQMIDVPEFVRKIAKKFDIILPTGDYEVRIAPKSLSKAKVLWEGGPGHATQGLADAPLRSAVMLHDSFYPYMHKYFSEHWQRLSCHWQLEFPEEFIDRERPDVVIQETAEKMLMTYIPQALPRDTAIAERPRKQSPSVNAIRR